MPYVINPDPVDNANQAAVIGLKKTEATAIAAIGGYLDQLFNWIWNQPAPATPSGICTLLGTGVLTRFQEHATLAILVLGQEVANGFNSAIHPWAIPQPGGGFAPGLPIGWGYIPILDANNNPTGAITLILVPSIVNAAAAQVPAGSNQINLSVLGGYGTGESNLTYTWSCAGATFNSNGTNAAKNNYALFTVAGTYTLTCTISDGTSSVTSSVTATISSVVSNVHISPTSAEIAVNGTQTFTATATDQFGGDVTSGSIFTWSAASGSINNGAYTAPATAGTDTVTVNCNGLSASAVVTFS